MIELFLLLFVLQGDTPSEWIDSCNSDFVNYVEKLTERNPDVLFCKYVNELDLSVDDLEKLGKEFDWLNYTMKTSKEFVDNWGFYQDHAIPETLLIYPSISMRDSLPPGMKVQISFDYLDESETKTFDESLKIYMKYDPEIIPLPENTWVIMPPEEPELPTLSDEQNQMISEYCRTGIRHLDMIGIPQCIKNEPEYGLDCPPTTHKFSQETQKCELWWNSAYVSIPILILIVSASIAIPIIVWKYRKRK